MPPYVYYIGPHLMGKPAFKGRFALLKHWLRTCEKSVEMPLTAVDLRPGLVVVPCAWWCGLPPLLSTCLLCISELPPS